MAELRGGSCLCGGIRYEVRGELRQVIACHCRQCRKQSGHFFAATSADDNALVIHGDSLKWYRSSPQARRGFCVNCGSVLFWKQSGDAFTSILAGSLDGPTGLRLIRHIHCADKGDYYEIADGLPQE